MRQEVLRDAGSTAVGRSLGWAQRDRGMRLITTCEAVFQAQLSQAPDKALLTRSDEAGWGRLRTMAEVDRVESQFTERR